MQLIPVITNQYNNHTFTKEIQLSTDTQMVLKKKTVELEK